jgi:hypothetical protein
MMDKSRGNSNFSHDLRFAMGVPRDRANDNDVRFDNYAGTKHHR